MPWMTGVRAMRAARTAGLGAPLIVMTALQDDSIPSQVKALGATLLRKPFDITELETVAAKLLAERREPAGRSHATMLVAMTAANNSTKGAPVPVTGLNQTFNANVVATAATENA